MFNFIRKHNILYKYQLGFREKYGTNFTLIVLTDKIATAILHKKLNKYVIRGIGHDWLQSYLYNRRQFVSFNNHCSDMNDITCGVPQGSIIGPLLFLLYVNDIVELSSVLIPLLYADDTSLFLIGKNINVLIHNMDNELLK